MTRRNAQPTRRSGADSAISPATGTGYVPADRPAASPRRSTEFGTAGGPPQRRVTVLLFFTFLAAYAYFCPGGGWNQNARFSQVRAIVESGTFAINDFLVYKPLRPPTTAAAPTSHSARAAPRLQRHPLPPDTPPDRFWRVGNTGDVTVHEGRVYPGKPPGTVLLAVPAYWLIYRAERALGVDPDDWWPLTVNAYLTRLLSVGLLAAWGGVLFYGLSRRLFPGLPERAHLWSVLSFGLATMMWPFATLIFDHVIVAVLLLLAFGWLVQVRDAAAFLAGARGSAWRLWAAGGALGVATVANYLSIIPIGFFSVYAIATLRPRRRVLWLWAGGVLPALVLAGYHTACFGHPTATANTEEPGMFQSHDLWLGMFGRPHARLLWGVLFSPHRGLFFFSPVLVLAVVGLVLAFLRRQRRAELLVAAGVFVSYVLMNASFQGWGKAWAGGWSFGPRYLIPGMALLALPLALAFARVPRLTLAAAVYSFGLTLLGMAVDPQPPVDILHPLSEYLLPLVRGEDVQNGKLTISGTVSANPIGVYEGFYYRAFPRGSPEARWNSFNLGEFLWPERRLSLVPLLVGLTISIGLLVRWTRPGAATCREGEVPAEPE